MMFINLYRIQGHKYRYRKLKFKVKKQRKSIKCDVPLGSNVCNPSVFRRIKRCIDVVISNECNECKCFFSFNVSLHCHVS